MTRRASILLATLCTALAPLPALAQAPPGATDTRYCMRVEALTGSRVERVRCWTRGKWEAQGVDVDRDWATEGVRIIDPVILTYLAQPPASA